MTSFPKTFKAVVIEKAEAPFTIKDVPLEQPKSGEVLIKTLACGVCHSDLSLQQGHFGPMLVLRYLVAYTYQLSLALNL